jgi:APA family basic amino acid/polyamine antiporter
VSVASADSAAEAPSLKRSLSLGLITFYGLGNILGAGIYVLIGKVAGHAGIHAPVSFIVASLLACLTAFTYAELAARFPYSAGEAVYLEEGFGINPLTRLVGLLIIVSGIVSAATIARGFVGYLQVFVPVTEWLAIACVVIVLGAIAAWGITESVRLAMLVTLVEVFGLLLVVWVAWPGAGAWHAGLAGMMLPAGPAAWEGIMLGAFLAFYAFIGFEDMVNVAEEVRDPLRNLPRAILLALGFSTLLYIAVAVVAVTAMPPQELAQSDAPLAILYRHATGREPVLITAISMFAVINGALIQIIMASRVCYGMSRREWLPPFLGYVHPVTRTPLTATVVMTVVVLGAAVWWRTETLAKATSYFILVVFVLVNLSLWRIKAHAPSPPGIPRVPRWVPLAGFAASSSFVVFHIVLDMAS